MTTATRAELLNRYASRNDEIERLRREQAKVLEELREITDTILADVPLAKLLTRTGVMVGNGQRVRFDTSLANTNMPLVVEDVPDVPFAFQVDEWLEEGATDE